VIQRAGTTITKTSPSTVLPGLVKAHAHLGIDQEAGGWPGTGTT